MDHCWTCSHLDRKRSNKNFIVCPCVPKSVMISGTSTDCENYAEDTYSRVLCLIDEKLNTLKPKLRKGDSYIEGKFDGMEEIYNAVDRMSNAPD